MQVASISSAFGDVAVPDYPISETAAEILAQILLDAAEKELSEEEGSN